ncbi:hypothetical protein Tco_0737750 [Tanacetum coccineum]
MIKYLKNQGNYKINDFKGMSYNDIRPIFEKVWDFNQNIVPMDAEKGSKKQKSPEKERSTEKLVEEEVVTQEEREEVVKEPATKRKKSIPRKTTRKRQKLEEDAEKDELKGFLDIVPREEAPIEIESLSTKFPIVDWKTWGFVDKFVRDPNKTPDSSQRPPQNCPKCGNPVDGLYCRQCALLRKKLKEVWSTICYEDEIFQDFLNTSESSNDKTNVVNAPQEPFVFNQDPGENSSQRPPHIDHHCCYGCGDSLDDGSSFTYDSTPNFIDDSPNVFNPPSQTPTYSCEFCGNDAHYGYDCPPQPSQCGKIPVCNDDDDDEESSIPLRDIIISELPPCIAITPVLLTEEPVDSLIIEDKHLDTIPVTESDEVIKSSVEDLVHTPSESDGISESGCDLPVCDDSSPKKDELTSVLSHTLSSASLLLPPTTLLGVANDSGLIIYSDDIVMLRHHLRILSSFSLDGRLEIVIPEKLSTRIDTDILSNNQKTRAMLPCEKLVNVNSS